MLCPKCKIGAVITDSRYILTEEEPKKLYLQQTFTCRNPQCSENGKDVGKIRNEIPLTEDKEEEPTEDISLNEEAE